MRDKNIGEVVLKLADDPLEILAAVIRASGPIPAARISSAQARGRAKQYSYWGVVPYEIRLNRAGQPTACPRGRASSDRRSYERAVRDLENFCERTGRVPVRGLGALTAGEAKDVLQRLGPERVGAAFRQLTTDRS